MPVTFKNYLSESISDRGIFKAVFVVGIPGAGKSYTVSKLKGTISPRVVNTDRATEHISRKTGQTSNSETWPLFRDDAQRITAAALAGYLDGMLPLFIDGTSNNVSNILGRAGILESLGYDVGMIYINVPVEQAISRAKDRAEKIDRHVDVEFINKTHNQSLLNKEYFKSKFHFFVEIDNADGMLTNEILSQAFKKTQKFFDAPLENPVGLRFQQQMLETKQRSLVPGLFTKETLKKKVEAWYK